MPDREGTPTLHREESGSGSGTPLVLVHGAWADARHWTRLARELAADFRVIAYDRRGHGRSGGRHATIDDDVRDLLAVLESTGAPAHVAAGSLGGAIALRAAVARPGAFLSLAVHEPALGGAPAAPERIPAPREFAEGSLGEGWWERLTDDERAGFDDNGEVWSAELTDPTAATEVHELAVPLLVTVGGASPPFWRQVADTLPATRVETIDGAGHLPHLTHARAYARVIAAFAGA